MKKYLWIGLPLIACLLALAPRQLLIFNADRIANRLSQDHAEDEQRILAAAKWVAARHDIQGQTPAYHFLLPVLTRVIPSPFRLPEGGVELITHDGECDAAARALLLLLHRMGYDAAQINLVAPSTAHTAVLLKRSNGSIYLDSYFGVAAISNDDDALKKLKSAVDTNGFDRVMVALRDAPDTKFYRKQIQGGLFRALSGEDPGITAKLPPLDGHTLQLGKVNDNTRDVVSALNNKKLTPFFHYVGSRYDRAWTRTLIAPEDLRLEMELLEPVKRELIVSEPPPSVNGHTVSWDLKAGQRLILFDNRTPKTWLSVPYQEADVIRIIPQKQPVARLKSPAPPSGPYRAQDHGSSAPRLAGSSDG